MPMACKVILTVVLAVWLHFAPWVYSIRECASLRCMQRRRGRACCVPGPARACSLAPSRWRVCFRVAPTAALTGDGHSRRRWYKRWD